MRRPSRSLRRFFRGTGLSSPEWGGNGPATVRVVPVQTENELLKDQRSSPVPVYQVKEPGAKKRVHQFGISRMKGLPAG